MDLVFAGQTQNENFASMRFRIVVKTNLWLLLQNSLVVIGVSASGAVAAALVVITLVRALLIPETPSEWGNWGAAYVLIFFIPVSLLLGGIAGCVAGLSWIGQHGNRRWETTTWAGVLLGLCVGLTCSSNFFGSSHYMNRLATVLVSTASATLAGTAISFFTAFRDAGRSKTDSH